MKKQVFGIIFFVIILVVSMLVFPWIATFKPITLREMLSQDFNRGIGVNAEEIQWQSLYYPGESRPYTDLNLPENMQDFTVILDTNLIIPRHKNMSIIDFQRKVFSFRGTHTIEMPNKVNQHVPVSISISPSNDNSFIMVNYTYADQYAPHSFERIYAVAQ